MKYVQILQKKVIERTKGVPYLVRWNLFGLGVDSSLFSIKVHHILVSDDLCLHDHPWAFLSIILKGGYREFTLVNSNSIAEREMFLNGHTDLKSKWFDAGSILYRKAKYAHRLVVPAPTWTLVFTFRKTRKWGFFSKNGWKHWSNYSKQKDC